MWGWNEHLLSKKDLELNQETLLRSKKNKPGGIWWGWVLEGLDCLPDSLLPSNTLGVWTLGF